MQIFRQAMKGDAFAWFSNESLADESADRNVSCAEWQRRLKAFYGKSHESVLDELENRRQREDEAAIDFIREMQRLCTQADPSMSDKARLRHLQRGLLPKFRKDMVLMNPDSTAAFGNCLLKLESTHRDEDDSRALLSSLLADASKPTAQPVLLAAGSSGDDDLKRMMADLLKQMKEMTAGRARRPLKDLTCFNCNEKGHVRAKCPKPQREGNDNGRS